jgi:hypothetical protein
MTTNPHPGTVAYQNPEPELVTRVRSLVSDDVDRLEAVNRLLSGSLDRREVEAAHIYWVRQVPRFAWDDYTGTHVLMIIEDILREIPRGT